jgi:hypothetical protein
VETCRLPLGREHVEEVPLCVPMVKPSWVFSLFR